MIIQPNIDFILLEKSPQFLFYIWLFTALSFIFFPRFSYFMSSIVISHTLTSILVSTYENSFNIPVLNEFSNLYIMMIMLTFLLWSAMKSFYMSFR
jgi:hypothetical protein